MIINVAGKNYIYTLTITTLLVTVQPIPILTAALPGARCVGTGVLTVTIGQGTLVNV